MAFKKITPSAAVPDTPDKLLLELPRRTIPDVLPHQQEVMCSYAGLPAEVADVALQLPTGSAETLEVGVVIASLVEHAIQNELESRSLAQFRDTLLPKLISGELRINEIDKSTRMSP